jgi:hypothetical protein
VTSEAVLVAPVLEPASPLEAAAQEWVDDYFNALHLRRTRDWVVELDPTAGVALRVAALTHDIERREPGGPRLDPRTQAWDDAAYLREHSERSAVIVDAWLEARGDVAAKLRASVGELIRAHEIGGGPAASRLQAADSLSFLEVNAGRARAWVEEGRCTVSQARAKLDWMLARVRLPRARALAEPLYAQAVQALGSS